MEFERYKTFIHDPRHFQILTLSSLVLMQMFWADFGPTALIVLSVFLSVLITQAVCSFYLKIPFDFRSPLITGLSLSMLLKAGALWVYPLAGFLAIASKFFIRSQNKHVFNPANFGIVMCLLFLPEVSWVSTGQWGQGVLLGLFLTAMAFFVLFRIPSKDIVFLFLGFWVGLIFARAGWLGDPWAIPFHQVQNGALLIFAFFMISDPKTIPDHFAGRFVFALAVAVIAFIMQFEFQIREGLFYALTIVCMIRPLLDKLSDAVPYQWKDSYS